MALKEKIIHTANELFYKFGIKRITMDDISREMGISKKTLYLHFKEKDEIVNQLCHATLAENVRLIEEIRDNAKDPIHELIEAGKHMSVIFSKINPVFFYDLKRYYTTAWTSFVVFKEKHMLRLIEENLRKGIEQGIYRKEISISLTARYRLIQFDMALDHGTFPVDKMNLAEIQLFLLDHFMHGITTLKGHKLINKYKEIKDEE